MQQKKNCNCWLMDTVELPGLKSKGDPQLNKTHILRVNQLNLKLKWNNGNDKFCYIHKFIQTKPFYLL